MNIQSFKLYIQIVFPYLYALQMQAAKTIYFPRTLSRQNIAEQILPKKKYLISSSCVTICLGFCAKVFCHLHFLFEIHSSLNPACKLAPQTFAPIIECFLKIDPSMFSQPIFLSRSNHFHIQKLTISIGSENSKCLFKKTDHIDAECIF